MTKAKKKAVNAVSQAQAARFLAAAKAGGVDKSGRNFAQAMGKVSLRKNGRKNAKGGVGGGAEGA